LHLIAFSLSWPAASGYAFIPTYAIAAAMLYFHVLGVEPQRPERMRWMAIGLFVAGTGLAMWFNQQTRDRLGEELYMSHLFPPALRLARPSDTGAFVKGLEALQPKLDAKAKKHDGGSSDDGPDEE
jgi:hypothetical protein